MKKIISLCICLLAAINLFSQSGPKLSLLTFATGTETYSVFGHTAIRVQDFQAETDIVYNFGIFDFDAPNFLLKFIKGELDYRLGIEDYNLMLQGYASVERQVTEQPLNLKKEQAEKLLEKLEFLYRPENRYYRYGFLQKNCSTELRDLLFTDIKDVAYTPTETDRTYRHYLNTYTTPTPWLKFGINLALGSPIDKKINSFDLMFLPDYLSEEAEKATINNTNLTGHPKKLLPNLPNIIETKWQLTPFLVFAFLFVVMVLGRSKVLIQTFTFCVGIGGLILLGITLFSIHPEVQNNYNLLWCNPLYLVSFGLCFTQYKKFHKIFATVLVLGLFTTLGIWFSKIQGYDYAFFPIVISLIWINLKQAQRK